MQRCILLQEDDVDLPHSPILMVLVLDEPIASK